MSADDGKTSASWNGLVVGAMRWKGWRVDWVQSADVNVEVLAPSQGGNITGSDSPGNDDIAFKRWRIIHCAQSLLRWHARPAVLIVASRFR